MPKYTSAELITDGNGNPMPQIYNPQTDAFKPWSGELVGSYVEEQLTEADAVTGTLTFSQGVEKIEIYNRDSVSGVFTVNNIDLTIPAGQVFAARIGGISNTTVTVTGSTSYIVTRYS